MLITRLEISIVFITKSLKNLLGNELVIMINRLINQEFHDFTKSGANTEMADMQY